MRIRNINCLLMSILCGVLTLQMPAGHSATSECDALAANPNDPGKPSGIAGVTPISSIDHNRAIPACPAAAESAQDNGRSLYQFGRSLAAAGEMKSALDVYYRDYKKDWFTILGLSTSAKCLDCHRL